MVVTDGYTGSISVVSATITGTLSETAKSGTDTGSDTVTADTLKVGYTAHDATGTLITGKAELGTWYGVNRTWAGTEATS